MITRTPVKFCFLFVLCSVYENSLNCTLSSMCSLQYVDFTSKNLKIYISTLHYSLKEASLSWCSSQSKIGRCLITSNDPRQQRSLSHPRTWLPAISCSHFTSPAWARLNFNSYVKLLWNSPGRQRCSRSIFLPSCFYFGYLLACLFLALGVKAQIVGISSL